MEAIRLARVTHMGSLFIGNNAVVSVAVGGKLTQAAGLTNLQGTLTAPTLDLAGGTLRTQRRHGDPQPDHVPPSATLAIAAATSATP